MATDYGSFQWPSLGGGGSGTVTSVGLAAPASILSVSGSPVTTSGTLSLSLITQSANLVWAGPTTGAAATPTFRALVAADISALFGNLTDVGTDGITVTGGTGAVRGAGTSIAQQVADATHNGYLSSTDWNTFNSKQAALTIGNLTDAGTDGITVTGGTGSVIGSGTSIAQRVADTTHNGYLSSTDWNTFNGKQAALTIGNLTDAGTDGITVTGGTGAIIGSGTSIAQRVADTTHNGYLSSTDWNTFNGKQAPGNYITALTGDGTASGPGSVALTLATVNSNVGTFASFTVNGKGLITAAAALSGDATTSSAVLTLATVNSNVGSFTNANITVNGKGLITAASNGTAAGTIAVAPTVQKFTSGSGTYNKNYTFIISSGSATVGATYTNNSVTFTVYATVSSSTQVVMSGSGAPTASGTLTKSAGTGDSSLTFSQVISPLYLHVVAVGGGGGGAGSAAAANNDGGNGGNGGNSTFGTTLLAANGGSGATHGLASGASGGSNSLGTGPVGLGLNGGMGAASMQAATGTGLAGGSGGNSALGGGASGGIAGVAGGGNGVTNSGGGGGGAGTGTGTAGNTGAGGGAGGYINAVITSPLATYAYAVGAAGTNGSAGTSGVAGGSGGSGVIVVTEHYQ